MENERIIKTDYIEYTERGKLKRVPYAMIPCPECTYKGMIGKHTEFGFIMKGGVKHDYRATVQKESDREEKKEVINKPKKWR
jgi:hypothetical protein